jgi:hypothetical protein
MLDYGTVAEDEHIEYTNTLPSDSAVIPITEFWISYCVKKHQCLISQKALLSSRSKKYFYELLHSADADSVRVFTNGEAEQELTGGNSVIVKPEGLCSGLGILVVMPQKKDKLCEYIQQALSINTKNMKLMELKNESCIITEYIQGTEYSADIFYCKGTVSIVRVCRKKIIIINDKPCTAVYQIIKPSKKIVSKLTGWANILFEKDNISFGQFDFIETNTHCKITKGNASIFNEQFGDNCRIIPIDFACRVGGGLTELLKETGTNPYADAVRGVTKNNVDAVSTAIKIASVTETEFLNAEPVLKSQTVTQLNYLPVKNGHLKSDNFNLAPGKQYVFKHKGDYVISFPSSIGSRVALVVQKRNTEDINDELLNSLLIREYMIE